MTLIELSIKLAKTAPAKTCTFDTDWKKCCIFQEEKDEDLTQRPTNSPEYHYGCYTMIAANMYAVGLLLFYALGILCSGSYKA